MRMKFNVSGSKRKGETVLELKKVSDTLYTLYMLHSKTSIDIIIIKSICVCLLFKCVLVECWQV